jgi:hypothetical protein
VTFLWYVLALGVVGNYRNASKIVASADDAEQRARLNGVLRAAAEASRYDDIRSAYTAMHGTVTRLRPAKTAAQSFVRISTAHAD